jgi:CelD/BcsL family acetyltransferase involved in cellulose biosynthesis
LTGLLTARDKAWARGSLGTLVLVESMEAARKEGFERLEMGGYFAYKQRLAPPGGFHHAVRVRPMLPPRLTATARRVRRLASMVRTPPRGDGRVGAPD